MHINSGVELGGVLEPPQAAPVVIEDNCFIGSNCTIIESAYIENGAVLGANVVVSGSTKVIDVTTSDSNEYVGQVPPLSIVIPGSYTKSYKAGKFQIPCALIIGHREESENMQLSLKKALQDLNKAL